MSRTQNYTTGFEGFTELTQKTEVKIIKTQNYT